MSKTAFAKCFNCNHKNCEFCYLCDKWEKKEIKVLTNYERLKDLSITELSNFLCDITDCSVCPAYDPQYCESKNLCESSKAMQKWLNTFVTD